MINQHSRKILEFNQVWNACMSFTIFEPETGGDENFMHADDRAGAPAGTDSASPGAGWAEPVFYTDEQLLRRELNLVALFKKAHSFRSHGLSDVPRAVEQLPAASKPGMVFELDELSRIVRLLYSYADMVSWLSQFTEDKMLLEHERQMLHELCSSWTHPREAIASLKPYFDRTGRFREDEIPQLRKILQRIQHLNGQIAESARNYLSRDRDIWSSNELSQRDGRVVLALKSDYRGKVAGLVHGSSNSGQTIYIEPQELLEKNNSLNEARGEYQQEVHRILRLCSESLRPLAHELLDYGERLRRFDMLQCRARYSISQGCNPAGIAGKGIRLLGARHPGLGKRAVPIEIIMEGDTKILVISGPNTGGKTVSMKTLGLLSTMHQCGMEIPASEGSELPLFSDILVDIGDEQSIDAGLSTFSAHLRNLSAVLASAGSNALILLDELGSGTNPTEGSALSMAVMERLGSSKAYAVVTTHHDSIKAYAYSSPGMENASVEFDGKSLQPTYRILPGVPGESHALDIARRVGMDEGILERAKSFLDDDGHNMQLLIENLRSMQQQLINELSSATAARTRLEQAERDLREREDELRVRELAIQEQALKEQGEFLSESRKTIDGFIEDLSRLKMELQERLHGQMSPVENAAGSDASRQTFSGRDSFREIRESLAEMEAGRRKMLERLDAEQEQAYEKKRRRSMALFEPGVRVRYRGSGKPAEILEKGKKKNSWIILAGSMRMTVQEKDLEYIGPQSGDSRSPGKVHIEYDSVEKHTPDSSVPAVHSGLTLDLRGRHLEEALKELEAFLDRCSVQGLGFFSVIHGKGTGVLQQGVHEYLRNESRVSSVSFAPPEDGGFGKSYVYLTSL